MRLCWLSGHRTRAMRQGTRLKTCVSAESPAPTGSPSSASKAPPISRARRSRARSPSIRSVRPPSPGGSGRSPTPGCSPRSWPARSSAWARTTPPTSRRWAAAPSRTRSSSSSPTRRSSDPTPRSNSRLTRIRCTSKANWPRSSAARARTCRPPAQPRTSSATRSPTTSRRATSRKRTVSGCARKATTPSARSGRGSSPMSTRPISSCAPKSTARSSSGPGPR